MIKRIEGTMASQPRQKIPTRLAPKARTYNMPPTTPRIKVHEEPTKREIEKQPIGYNKALQQKPQHQKPQ